ncbi:MAG: cupin-like domain-containing protein [Planctomycetota bacterium]
MTKRSKSQVWFEEESAFQPRRVAPLRHSFADHPSLQLDSLKRLAIRLKAAGRDQVKHIEAGATSEDPLLFLPEDDRGRSLEEVFDRVEEPGSWVSLYNVQTDPEYRELVTEVMQSSAHLLEEKDPGAFETDGFIFVSSAPSATPFHIDRENNFFLQIHGRKRMSVWDPADRVVVPEEKVESKMGLNSTSSMPFKNEHFARAAFNQELRAGEGVYIPATSGHTTNTEALPVGDDDTYSISIGVVFYTRSTRRAAYVYALNQFLRRHGLRPRPPYESALRDRLKYPFGRSLVLARKILQGFRVPPGM